MNITEDVIEGNFDKFTPYIIKCERGHIHGTHIHHTNQICVSHAMCRNCFKELIRYAIKKFKTNKILIYNIMNIHNWCKLKGFKQSERYDPMIDDMVTCLEGTWQEM